jgi:hypothetical protein
MNCRSGILTTARATALFVSDLSSQSTPTAEEIDAQIRRAIARHGGVRGCTCELAEAYGNHPETAAQRMRWARQLVGATYGGDR